MESSYFISKQNKVHTLDVENKQDIEEKYRKWSLRKR